MLAGHDRVIAIRRIPTPWSWGAVAAELDGLRTALRETDCDHVAILQGSDYPVQSSEVIERTLGDLVGRSITPMQRLPRAAWSGHGGLDRLRYPHWVVRRHMVRLPVPRRIPRGIVPAGGSVNKILSREHARGYSTSMRSDPTSPGSGGGPGTPMRPTCTACSPRCAAGTRSWPSRAGSPTGAPGAGGAPNGSPTGP